MEQKRPIKVLVAKPGLDGHDRGANVVAMGLRDEGMEVIYSGLRQTPEKIVNTAVQEDVDVIGLSILSGAHNRLFPEIIRLLKEKGKEDTLIIAGGHILEKDIPFMQEIGISNVFGHGVSVKSIAEYIRNNVSL